MNSDGDHLTQEEYTRRDYRIKCWWCGRWMRRNPTENTPARRAPPPNANLCTDCLADPSVQLYR